jgi:hypothetical protein
MCARERERARDRGSTIFIFFSFLFGCWFFTLSLFSLCIYLFFFFQVGKTSLLRALLALVNRTDAIAKEDRTIGLDLVRWELKKTLPSSKLTLNVQDFAGQEIYYATHQLFLSKRAAYLLVWDASRDDVEAQVEPWLDSLQANVPGALVLLVATHAAPELVSKATLESRVSRAQQCCQGGNSFHSSFHPFISPFHFALSFHSFSFQVCWSGTVWL